MSDRAAAVRPCLQVQPDAASLEEWEELARQENLSFELLEMSMPPALNESGRFPLYRKMENSGVRITSLHGAFIDVNPASGDGLIRALSRKRCEESCEAARELGAQNVVFHSSCFPFLRGAYLDSWAGVCAGFYEELAAKYDLGIFIENSMDVDASPIETLMSRISDKRIGVCLDFGHANYSRRPLEDWLERLGERIGYLHLSDNNGLFDDHLPLGEGTVDWEEADRFFAEAGRPMPVTLEVGGTDGVRRSLAFLKERGYFGCGEA